MKTLKVFIITFFISVSLSIYSYGQQITLTQKDLKEEEENSVKNNIYIFEYNILSSSGYHDKMGGTVTCTVMQITNIYRGSPRLKLGTIKIITDGGHVPGDPYMSPPDDGGPLLPPKHGIIFCVLPIPWKIADTTAMPVTDNSLILSPCNFIDISGQTAQWSGDRRRITLDSLNSFFKEKGLTVQEEVQQK